MKLKKQTLYIVLTGLLFSMNVFAQNGSAGTPFLALSKAYEVPSSGIYYFNISGQTFSSYVEMGTGWILAVSGDGSTTESSYSTTTNLTLQSDQILPAAIYTAVNITEVRMNATSGPGNAFDVMSSAPAVLNNLQNNRILSWSTNASDWSGQGTSYLQRNCAGNTGTLSTHIYHACGNGSNLHWQVGKITSHEKLIFSNANKNDLNLWIRVNQQVLPIELNYFKAELNTNCAMNFSWSTSSENNNSHFIIEQRTELNDWQEVVQINSKTVNSTELVNYAHEQFIDFPKEESVYMRLVQIDLNGKRTHFDPVAVEGNSACQSFSVFPNPMRNELNLSGAIGEVNIFNSLGQDITNRLIITELNTNQKMIDVSSLANGIYFISNQGRLTKVLKN